MGTLPAYLQRGWHIACASDPLPGDMTWRRGGVYLAAGPYAHWSADWHRLGGRLVACATRARVLSLVQYQLATRGHAAAQALAQGAPAPCDTGPRLGPRAGRPRRTSTSR
jgi:hypothetical protein